MICISGWPKERLSEPALKARTTPAWEDFPAGLLRDVDAYLSGIQKVHRGFSGKRIPSLRGLDDPHAEGRTQGSGLQSGGARLAN